MDTQYVHRRTVIDASGRELIDETSDSIELGAFRRGPSRRYDPLRGLSVADACVSEAVCALPTAPIEAIREALAEHAIGAVVVVDTDWIPIGVVSAYDLALAEPTAREACDVMTTRIITVATDFPLSRAAAVMAFEGIHHLPVTGSSGRILGLVSSIDILRSVGLASGAILPPRTARRRFAEREET